MDFGPTFKIFREKKGFRAKDVAEGIVSVQFLRRFEKGEADIRLSNFYQLLHRINVSFEEFIAFMELDSIDYTVEKLEKDLDYILLKKDAVAMDRLTSYFAEQGEHSGNSSDQHFHIMLQVLSNQIFHTNYQPETDKLMEYLENCETWGSHEFFLANYASIIFTDEALFTHAKMALERGINSRITHHYANDFLFRVCMHLIWQDKDNQAMELIQKFRSDSELKPLLQFLLFHIAFVFLEGVVLGKNGDPKGYESCEEVIDFFYHRVGYKEYANNLQMHLRHLQKSLK